MTIQSIKDFSTGFGMSSDLVSSWATLSEYKAGKIHLFYETVNRFAVVENSLSFTRMVLEKLAYARVVDQLQSNPIKWAIRLTPVALGYLKYQTQKSYPLLAKSLSYLENCVEKAAYATFVIGSIALVRFGHLSAGYSALSALVFNQIISSDFAKSHLPLLDKVDAVFKIYVSPIIGLVGVAIGGSYLTIGRSLFSLILMAHASLNDKTCIIQKSQISTQNSSLNNLTIDKWEEFNTDGDVIFLTINRERIPKITFPPLSENMDTKQSILDILTTLPENLQKKLIDRINNIPTEDKIQTFEEAKLVAEKYVDALISFAKQRSDSIWNALLQQSCSMLQQLNPDQQFSGVIELLFGNEGKCQVAQQRNILSGFLTLSKATHTAINTLELLFNLKLENLSSENFRHFLQAFFDEVPLLLKKEKGSSFFSRSFVKIASLFYRSVSTLTNLTDMHNYQRYEKLYGPHFGIKPIAKDLVAESSNVDMMSSPLLYVAIKCLFKFNVKKTSATYFTTQLHKITPWLRNQITVKTTVNRLFDPNEITQWFSSWIEKQNLPGEEIATLQDELIEEGTIAGYPVYRKIESIDPNSIEPIALIAFLYGMDVLTDSLEEDISTQIASIQDLIESLDPAFDSLVRDFEKNINELDHTPIENPSLAKERLINYLISSDKLSQDKKDQFTHSLTFSKQDNISIEEQAALKQVWSDKAAALKEKFKHLPLVSTKINLRNQLYNLVDLKNLNLSPEILFV